MDKSGLMYIHGMATIGYKCTEMYWGGELGFHTKAVNRKSCCCCWFAAAHKREREGEVKSCTIHTLQGMHKAGGDKVQGGESM